MLIRPLPKLSHLKNDSTNYMNYVNENTKIKTKFGVLTREDFKLLNPMEWLDDKIIWGHTDILNQHFKDFLIINPNIASYINHSSVCDTKDWARHKSILFPVCTGDHWILVEFTFTELVIYDSLRSNKRVHAEQVVNLQSFIYKQFHLEVPIVMSTQVTKDYHQPNLDDCGVYMLMFAKGIVSETCFFKGNMDIYRNRITHELLTQRLIYNNE